jgi:class 3 adenylate cyclase
MVKRNVHVELAKQMRFRIGINLGDVIHDEARVYGDGVNIAARLENIADPGGICISDKVHAEIQGKVQHRFHDLGRKKLKILPTQFACTVGGHPDPITNLGFLG